MKAHGLKDTEPRRKVRQALSAIRKPASPSEISAWLLKQDVAVNLVTIYRVLAAFEKSGLAHRHPCDGKFSFCTQPAAKGHHGFLHCHRCGKTEEFIEPRLCKMENHIARKAGFRPSEHVSEILGTCAICTG